MAIQSHYRFGSFVEVGGSNRTVVDIALTL